MATSWNTNQPIAGAPWPLGANNDSASGRRMSARFRSRVAAAPFGGPPCEPALADDRLHLVREPNQVPHIVQRQEPQPQQLLRDEQVPEVAAREGGAGLAVARLVQRPRILAVLGVANVHRAVGREGGAVAAVAGGRDAVEQIDATLHR